MRNSMWVPRARVFAGHSGSSFALLRWGTWKLDYLKTKNIILLQYGVSTVHFICKVPKDTMPPAFLLSINWKTKRNWFGVRSGTTKKPLNIAALWGNICQQDSGQRTNTNMTKQIKSGNGLTIHT